MRYKLLLPVSVLVFTALLALSAGLAGVGAVGPLADNATALDIPDKDQPGGEIRPPVKCVPRGPSALSETAPPDFIPTFIAPLGEDSSRVSGDQEWYLDVDISAPGWLYIYEYLPKGSDPPGGWIAYKWLLPEGGVWRLGPFTPEASEPEGEHIYRVWFYSNGYWAGEETEPPQGKLVHWTYSRGLVTEEADEETATGTPTVPAESRLIYRLRALATSPLAVAVGTSALLLLALLSFYLFRTYAPHRKWVTPPPVGTVTEKVPLPPPTARAKIALPNGMEVLLDSGGRTIGREDLARALDIDGLALVSRRHFEVRSQEGQFFIEDLGSTNGTRLNGVEIGGRGPVVLSHGDVIELADRIQLKFYTF